MSLLRLLLRQTATQLSHLSHPPLSEAKKRWSLSYKMVNIRTHFGGAHKHHQNRHLSQFHSCNERLSGVEFESVRRETIGYKFRLRFPRLDRANLS